ncbi:potassium channel, subfamily K, member 16-like [Diadema antillarum]|uniref:potassium channel, subfamily K, member 16-like n=1 Tax=Diadema antillarum TaxID=105358 RepID=UPI003A8544A8
MSGGTSMTIIENDVDASQKPSTTGSSLIWQTRWQLLAVFAIFWIYLVVGAFMFSAIERGNADNLHEEFMVALTNFEGNHSCVHHGDLLSYSNALVDAYSGGLRWNVKEGFNHSSKYGYQHWDFIDSLFFCATVVSTIGYGRLAPSTQLGQSVCIIYALIGIPLSGLLVATIGQQLKNRREYVWKSLLARVTCLTSARSSAGRRIASITALFIALTLFYVVLIIIPACMFYFIEGWDWLTSQYYAFISFTTIGFGDYVAGDGPNLSTPARIAYKLLLICYLVIGMGFVTMAIHHMQDRNARSVRRLTKQRIIRRTLKKRLSAKGDTPDGISSEKVPMDDEEEIVVITVDGSGQGEGLEMANLGGVGVKYETVSLVDGMMQTAFFSQCDASTQTDFTTPSINDSHHGNGMHIAGGQLNTKNRDGKWQITENVLYNNRT